jgi:hypothetical protein
MRKHAALVNWAISIQSKWLLGLLVNLNQDGFCQAHIGLLREVAIDQSVSRTRSPLDEAALAASDPLHVEWVSGIFDRFSGFCLPFDVSFAPKATVAMGGRLRLCLAGRL